MSKNQFIAQLIKSSVKTASKINYKVQSNKKDKINNSKADNKK